MLYLSEEAKRLLRLGFLPGLVGGGLAVAFRTVVELLNEVPALFLPLTGAAVGFLSLWLYRRAPYLRGGGVDQVLFLYHRGRDQVSPSLGLLKALLTALTLGLGGSGGQEGPLLFAAGALAQILRPRNAIEAQTLLLAGGAGSVAALFHTPLGAAFFAAEVLYRGAALEGHLLAYLTVAAITGYGLQSLFFGTAPLLPVPEVRPLPLWPGLLLAPVAAVAATAWTRGLAWTRKRWQPRVLPFSLALSGVLTLAFSWVRGTSYEALGHLLAGSGPDPLLFIPLKALAVLLSAGTGASVGLFGPSVVLGGALGTLMGHLLHIPGPEAALLGMAALVSATARTPFAAVVQMVEITGAYTLLVPGLAVAFGAFLLTRETLFPLQPRGPEASPAHAENLLAHLNELPPNHPILTGKLGAVLIALETEHPWANKVLRDLPLPPGVRVGLVFRLDDAFAPVGEDRLMAGDRILFFGPRETILQLTGKLMEK